MASKTAPTYAKRAVLSDGTTYGYVHIPPSNPAKPTLLLLHGFPSSSHDWRHLIGQLQAGGYGVVAPDLLGYGDTDKPAELERYKYKPMTRQVIEILDKEGFKEVVAVCHDWGAAVASRLVNYYPERLIGLVSMAVRYVPPGMKFDLDAANAATEKAFGYPTAGYMHLMISPEGPDLISKNPESFRSLVYPADAELWKTDLCPRGKAKAWLEAGKTGPLPDWITEEEQRVQDEIFADGGYVGPCNWYKTMIENINTEDEESIPADKRICNVPNLLILGEKDYASRVEMQLVSDNSIKEGYRTVEILKETGHWVQLEKKDEVWRIMEGWLKDVLKV